MSALLNSVGPFARFLTRRDWFFFSLLPINDEPKDTLLYVDKSEEDDRQVPIVSCPFCAARRNRR